MIDFYLNKISISEIDISNFMFRISEDADIDTLCDSIRAFGLINPPILKKNNHEYIIVSGFKRVYACKELGHNYVTSLILNEKDEFFCQKLAILDNSNNRTLSFKETVNCIRKIQCHISDELEISKEINGLLKNTSSDKLINKLLKIITLPENILNLIDRGYISMSIAEELVRYEENVVRLFGVIFEKLRTSSNYQKDIFNLIVEIKFKEKKDFISILNDVDRYLDMHIQTYKDTGSAYKKVKNYLYARRFPEITRYTEKIENKLEHVKLDRRIRIKNITSGDENLFQFQFDFDSVHEFEELILNIKQLQTNTKFIELVSLNDLN